MFLWRYFWCLPCTGREISGETTRPISRTSFWWCGEESIEVKVLVGPASPGPLRPLTSQRLFWVISEGRTKRQENGFCWIVEYPAHRLVNMRGPGAVNTFLSRTRPSQPSRADQNVRLLTSKVQTIQNNLILMIYKWPSSLQLENCLSPLQLSIFNPRNTCYRYLLLILMKWPNTRKGKSRIQTSKV